MFKTCHSIDSLTILCQYQLIQPIIHVRGHNELAFMSTPFIGCLLLLNCGWLEWTNRHQCTNSRWGHLRCFGDEPKTHPLPLPKDFLGPFFAPKFSPNTYLPCCYLPHLISCLLHITKLRGDVRHKAWGRWRAQHWRNVKRRRQEKHFIPNTEAREER
jgi:hypothetical protein